MAGLATLLLIVSFASYLRMRTMNMAFLVAVFAIYIAKGILLLAEVVNQSTGLVILIVQSWFIGTLEHDSIHSVPVTAVMLGAAHLI